MNDTSSVVAAGYTFSNASGNLAVIVKLTRTIMIVPITLVLAFYTSRKTAGGTSYPYPKAQAAFLLRSDNEYLIKF